MEQAEVLWPVVDRLRNKVLGESGWSAWAARRAPEGACSARVGRAEAAMVARVELHRAVAEREADRAAPILDVLAINSSTLRRGPAKRAC